MATDGANAGVDDLITITSEARVLFSGEGSAPGCTPAGVSRAMPSLREQRRTRRYCDVVFQASDGSQVWAHRFIMAYEFSGCASLFAAAKYKKAQNQDWTPSIRVVMSDILGEMLQLLVDFTYQAPLHSLIRQDNIHQVLEMADTYNIAKIRDFCLNELKNNIDAGSCISTYHLARERRYSNLAKDAFVYLTRHFDKVVQYKEPFLALSSEELRSILAEPRLEAPSEMDVFHAILEWTSQGPERQKYLAHFLPLIRFIQFTAKEMRLVIINDQVQADTNNVKVLSAIHRTLTGLTHRTTALGKCAGVDMSAKLWLKPRVPNNIMFSFGGCASLVSSELYAFNSRTAKWRFVGEQPTSPRAYHGVAVVESCIYIVGGYDGQEFCHSVACFNMSNKKWMPKANMNNRRCYVSVATLQGHIYAMGGFDGRRHFNTVERYDAHRNQWNEIAAMNDIRSSAAATTSGGRIYIVGGFTGQEVLDTVECYDPSSDAWTRLRPMSTPRYGLQVIAHDDILYILGGIDGGATSLSSMEQFEIITGAFNELPPMSETRCYFAAAIHEGFIYTFGGRRGPGTADPAERYDIARRQWHPTNEIGKRWVGSTAFVVCDVPNPEVWLGLATPSATTSRRLPIFNRT